MSHQIARRRQPRSAFGTPGANRGLTLIELLVTLTISSFLLVGLYTIEQNTLRTSINQTALVQLQDNERLAMSRLTDTIQQAGFFTAVTVNTQANALPAQTVAGIATFAAGQSVTGTHTAAATPDKISVRFLAVAADGLLNCDGTTTVAPVAPGNIPVVNTFTVDPVSGYLACRSTTNGVTTDSILVPGLSNMQVKYGVNTSAAANGPVDTYLDATQMTAAYWQNVLSVRVTLTFVNPIASQPGQPATVQMSRVIGIMNRAGVN